MFAVSISLGASNAYVAVAPLLPGGPGSVSQPAAIKIIANSSGHRATPVAAALTEQEILFGENALHAFARQPQKVVPGLFTYSAAAAAISDTDEEAGALTFFMRAVEQALKRKYKGHCSIGKKNGDEVAAHQPLGFIYDVEKGDDVVEEFVAAEDLFVKFLNYVKEHSVDGVCGLTASSDAPKMGVEKKIILTVVVPRYAFPAAVLGGSREEAVEWLQEAVNLSNLGSVALTCNIIFSDEASLLAFDSAPSRAAGGHYFVCPPTAGAQLSLKPIPAANVLVVDWGAHTLSLSLLQLRGGAVIHPKSTKLSAPYMCSTSLSAPEDARELFSQCISCGGDALDAALADRVAAHFILQQRRAFAAQVRNMNILNQLDHNLTATLHREGSAGAVIAECIPARALRRLRLLMEEKKLALNTNPQAVSVSVEMEAFYEGMDLVDNQTFNRNKFEVAVRSEWGLLDMFERALCEFIERNGASLVAAPIDYALLTGGMCQMSVVASNVANLLRQSSNASIRQAVVQSVEVLDSSVVGNGVAADELAAVGGCLNSYHVGLVCLSAKEAKAPLKGKRSHSKIQQAVRREAVECASVVLEALEGSSAAAERDTEDEAGETDTHASFLQRNVYVYVGEDMVSLFSTGNSGDGGALIPAEHATLLVAKNTLLPSRVLIRCSGSISCSDKHLAICLLTDSDDAASSTPGHLRLRPATRTCVMLPCPQEDSSEKPNFVAVTAAAKASEDCDERRVVISLQSVTGANGTVPLILTPANTSPVIEVPLY